MDRNRQIGKALMRRIAPTQSGALGKTVPELRRLADAARSRQDWNADLYYRRHIVQSASPSMGDWVQYGHALKEAGFYAASADAYLRGLEMKPDNAEIALQLGHLSKVRGNFEGAASWFRKALDFGSTHTEQIAVELGLMRRIDNSVVFREVGPHMARTRLRVYLSVPGGQVTESDKTRMAVGLGHSDYSYAFAMRGFADALDALEVDHTVLKNPEFISDIRPRSTADINIHLSFYPPERLRLLKGAYNVNCFAWEFDRLRSPEENLSFHAFADQATMLELPDEVWTPSEHGAKAVQASISTPVKAVAAPILNHLARKPRAAKPGARDIDRQARVLKDVAWQPLAVLPRIQPQVNGGAKARESSLQAILSLQVEDRPPAIYVSVFNAHDYRKQIGPMIEGFREFSRTHPEAILLCKITTVERNAALNDILYDEQIKDLGRLISPMISDRIWLTRQILTRDEMTALFDVATYYLCTSHAEGQNLPLIEAMARGVVPVSVDNTAMESYVSEANALVIPSERKPFGRRLTARYGLFGLETHFVSVEGVAEALDRSAHLDDAAYAARSAHALETVRDVFGLERFAAKFDALVASLETKMGQA